MKVHDWTLVPDSTFHDFHGVWVGLVRIALNRGVLPSGYYAQTEQHIGPRKPDMLALHRTDPDVLRTPPVPAPTSGAVAVLDAPPAATRRVSAATPSGRRKTLTVRHTSGHRIIALLEVVSPGNKDRAESVEEFAGKVGAALRSGVHATVADLFPPGRHDPDGMHAAVRAEAGLPPDVDTPPPPGKPLTFASYVAGRPQLDAYLFDFAVGDPIPDVPLFLTPDYYVTLPLADAYRTTYEGTSEYWREVLEGRRVHTD